MSEKAPAEVLVVDDEKTVCQSVEKIVRRMGHKVFQVLSANDALDEIEKKGGKLDLVIADLMMPQVDGLALLKAVKARWPNVNVLIITGYGSISSAVEATKMGAIGYVPKPFTPDELEKAIKAAIDQAVPAQPGPDSELPLPGPIDVDMPFDAREVAEATSAKYVERLTRSDVSKTIAPDYCSLGARSCKRFVKQGQCKAEECPIVVAERKKNARSASVASFVSDPIDVDMPFSAKEVAALTSDAYVASLGRSDLPIVGHWAEKPAGDAQKVLVVDDEAVVVNSIRKTLARKGLAVEYAYTAMEGLAKALTSDFDLVLVDMKLPDMNGMELLSRIKRRLPETPVVMVTGFASIDTAVEAIRRGANDYMAKPFTPDELYQMTGKFLTKAA